MVNDEANNHFLRFAVNLVQSIDIDVEETGMNEGRYQIPIAT